MSNALCCELDFVGSKLLHMFVFAIRVAASHNGLRHKWILFRRNVLYHHHPKMQLQCIITTLKCNCNRLYWGCFQSPASMPVWLHVHQFVEHQCGIRRCETHIRRHPPSN